ncbi:MAG: hypothetical protein FJZ01_14670 [Candidatus Sericytochromatia bacterium]|nr:hypothetical protein [Candidatus Tanganyikabacteria bacterium]
MNRALSATLSVLLLAGCGLAPGLGRPAALDLSAASAGKAWTYAALSASDNDLSEDAVVLERAARRQAGLPNVAPVLFVDRDKADDSLRIYPGPKGAVAEAMPELDSESPAAMRDLLRFAAKVAPAKRRLLVLADHGGGIIRGINSDDHRPRGGPGYSVGDFAEVLRADPVDILYFDACFMQMVEVAHEFGGGEAAVILASESETTSGSAPHAGFMQTLDEGSRLGTDAAAARLVEAGAAMARKDATLSAVRPAAVRDLVEPLRKLSGALLAAMREDPALKGKLREAMGGAVQYVHETDPHYALYNSYRDLGDVLDRIAAVSRAEVAAQARALAALVRRDVVIGHVEARTFAGSSGITIYAPAGEIVDAGYVKTDFARKTRWADFLVALNSGGKWANPVQPDKYPDAFKRPRGVVTTPPQQD